MAVYGIPRAGKVSAKGAPLDIAAMLFWMFTVGAGLYLLVVGRPADPWKARPHPNRPA